MNDMMKELDDRQLDLVSGGTIACLPCCRLPWPPKWPPLPFPKPWVKVA